VIIPAYNESGNIRILCEGLNEILSKTHYSFEIIFVDDGSSDDTIVELVNLHERFDNVHYLRFSRNFGHQAAIKAGIDYARGNAIISMDADLQHPPHLITSMLEKWAEGYDVVYTQRINDDDISKFKRFSSSLFYTLLRKMSDVPIEEGTADFRLIDAKVASVIRQSKDPFLFLRGLIPWLGFKQYKLSYKAEKRFSGVTKYSLSKMLAFAINGITGFSIKPLRFAIFLGILISLLAFVYALYAVLIYLFNDHVISGWASVMVSILFIGGIQLIILGIIGEYIGKIYIQLKSRPFYIVAESTLNQKHD